MGIIKSLVKEYLVVALSAICWFILAAMIILLLFKATHVLHWQWRTVIAFDVVMFYVWIVLILVKNYLK